MGVDLRLCTQFISVALLNGTVRLISFSLSMAGPLKFVPGLQTEMFSIDKIVWTEINITLVGSYLTDIVHDMSCSLSGRPSSKFKYITPRPPNL